MSGCCRCPNSLPSGMQSMTSHNHDTTTDYAAIIRLLMLTGQRRGEIGDLRCECARKLHDDGDHCWPAIVLPAERTKNGGKHIVPLSKPAQTILLARLRGADDEFVFRRKNDRPSHLRSWHRRKEIARSCIGQAWP